MIQFIAHWVMPFILFARISVSHALTLDFQELTDQGPASLNIWSQSHPQNYSQKLVYYGDMSEQGVFKKCLALAFVKASDGPAGKFLHYTSKMWDREPNNECDYTSVDQTSVLRSPHTIDLRKDQRIIDSEAMPSEHANNVSYFRAIEFTSQFVGQFDAPGEPPPDILVKDIRPDGAGNLIFSFTNNMDYRVAKIPHMTNAKDTSHTQPPTPPPQAAPAKVICSIRADDSTVRIASVNLGVGGSFYAINPGTIFQFTGRRDFVGSTGTIPRAEIQILTVNSRFKSSYEPEAGMKLWTNEEAIPSECLRNLNESYPRNPRLTPAPPSAPVNANYNVRLTSDEPVWLTLNNSQPPEWIGQGAEVYVLGVRGVIHSRGTRVGGQFIPPKKVNVRQVRIISHRGRGNPALPRGRVVWMEDSNINQRPH